MARVHGLRVAGDTKGLPRISDRQCQPLPSCLRGRRLRRDLEFPSSGRRSASSESLVVPGLAIVNGRVLCVEGATDLKPSIPDCRAIWLSVGSADCGTKSLIYARTRRERLRG